MKIIISKRHKHHIWFNSISAAVLIIFMFNLYLAYRLIIDNKSFDYDFEPFATALICISGLLFAFSAISIYSVFNANIDRERALLQGLIQDSKIKLKKQHHNIETYLEGIRENITTTENKIAKQGEDFTKLLNDVTNMSNQYNNNWLFIYNISIITNQFMSEFQRNEALMSLRNEYNILNSDTMAQKSFSNKILPILKSIEGQYERNNTQPDHESTIGKNFIIQLKNFIAKLS